MTGKSDASAKNEIYIIFPLSQIYWPEHVQLLKLAFLVLNVNTATS